MKEENRIILVGTITQDIQPDLLYHGVLYYKTYMEVIQPSGYIDQIMIVAKKRLFKKNGVKTGRRVYIEGAVETRNEYDLERKRHVTLYVRALTIRGIQNGKDRNEAVLKGKIIKEPNYHLPTSGISKIHLILETEDTDENTISYIPCVGYKRLAELISKLDAYQELEIEGHFHSRTYLKKGEEVKTTAYEILIHEII